MIGILFALKGGYFRAFYRWPARDYDDRKLNPLAKPFIDKTVVLADYGFRDKDGVPDNMKICKKGTWNERICVETANSGL
jgi:hypothetical protein